MTVSTGRGYYIYFRAPAEVRLGNQVGRLHGYGVDVRGSGGYVVGPGSMHVTSALYTVVVDEDPSRCPGGS